MCARFHRCTPDKLVQRDHRGVSLQSLIKQQRGGTPERPAGRLIALDPHLVTELLHFIHCCRAEDVRPDGEGLP